ncbi:MAG: polyprenyl synthetase family protein [Chloroflexi bacterium]|nr:polyprenyl synthetase family protein [Chloroflexota bacterium]
MALASPRSQTLAALDLVEDALRGVLSSHVGLLATAGQHIVASGGKRIRPQVALLAYGAAGGDDVARAVPLAAAAELIHTASLIHDDINDRSDTRRGHSTVNSLWGDNLALLTGDFVFVRLLGLLPRLDGPVIQALADACLDVVEGETRQMLTLGRLDLTEEEHLDIVRQKTAGLFASCAYAGGLLAGARAEDCEALERYGRALGMTFQLRDDVLDLAGSPEEMGKPIARDVEQCKVSLATVYGLRADPEVGRALRAGEHDGVRRMLASLGALDRAMAVTRRYAAEAQEALEALPPSEDRQGLWDLAEYAATRRR